MEWSFTFSRFIVFALLIGLLAWLGGFSMPEIPEGTFTDTRRLTKAWFQCALLFCAGAISATFVDHYVGNIDRTNLRFLYILLGLVMMLVGIFWLRSLQQQFSLIG